MNLERTRTRVEAFRMHAVHTGEGPPVVLLHGLCGSHRWWRFTVPALQQTRRVHLPEMVGFGGSRGAGRLPGILEMANLMGRWMDALELDRPDFVGHSMGAQVAIHLAAREPDRFRRLVLVSAAGIPHPISPLRAARLGAELVRPRAWGRPTFLPTIATDALRTGPRNTLRAVAGIVSDDVRPLLPSVAAPTLLMFGEHDPLTPVRDGRLMARQIPRARLAVIPDAAHNPMADQPAAFNRLLIEFLDSPVPAAVGGAA